VALIETMAGHFLGGLTTVTWGAERIRGELLKLGIKVAKSTIQEYSNQVRSPIPTKQTWATFLRNHAQDTCIIRAMSTVDSDGSRPPAPSHADHSFRRMASSFSGAPESVVALVWNQWTACSGIGAGKTDLGRSGAG